MKKSLAFTSLLIAILGLFSVIFGQESQLHPFVNDENLCGTCHATYQIAGSSAAYIVVKADSSLLPTDVCLECHPQGETCHPVRITVSFQIPKDLPLSKNNELTCVTCHNPHYSKFSDRPWVARSFISKMNDTVRRKNQYKTYFLRRNNAQGELCLCCHKRQRDHYPWKD